MTHVPPAVLVRFVYALPLGVAEGVDSGDANHLGDLELERASEDGLGSLNVGGVHRWTPGLGDADLVHRRDVNDRAAAEHSVGDRPDAAQVSLNQLAADLTEPSRGGPVANQGDDVVAALAQPPGDLRPDETGSPGHENLHLKSSLRLDERLNSRSAYPDLQTTAAVVHQPESPADPVSEPRQRRQPPGREDHGAGIALLGAGLHLGGGQLPGGDPGQ